MSDFPFDIPTTQPSSGGGGGLPFVSISTQAQSEILNPYVDGKVIPDFSITITPTSATQKVHLSGVINGEWTTEAAWTGVFIKRNGSSLRPTGGGDRMAINGQFLQNHNVSDGHIYPETCPFSIDDEPQTTSELTYEVWLTCVSDPNSDFFLNRTVTNTDQVYYRIFTSSFSAQCF